MEPGKTSFFLGAMRLQHPGGDLEIVDVEVITSPNVEYLGAFTVWPRDYPTNKHSVGLGYPPPQLKDRHPALDTLSETAFMPSSWGQDFPPPSSSTPGSGSRPETSARSTVSGSRTG